MTAESVYPTWPVHPAADLFPMMSDGELDALANDIAAHGLQEMLVLYDDSELGTVLLDGRNRLAACRRAGVVPETWYHTGDPIQFVISANIHRRHLTTGQLAMLGAEILPMYEAAAAKRTGGRPTRAEGKPEADLPQVIERAPQARDQAAAVVGTSSRAVAQAKRVSEKAPDLAEKVRAGELALDAAEKQTKRREAQKQEQEAREATLSAVMVDASGDRWRLLHGDFRERLADLPDGSVDLIVTDPPYPTESLPLWSDLAKHAARVLADDGILVGLTGQLALPEVMARLGEHLNYGWCYVQPLPGANSRIMGRHVLQSWKPWLAYTRNKWPSGRIDWHPDVLDPSTRAKDQYRWAQGAEPAEYLITELCPEGGTVLDPFTGVGTYGAAALKLGRRFVGVELDAGRFEKASERLGQSHG